MKLDLIRAVESCYASACDEEAWLGRLLEPFAALDRGPGQCAQTFRIGPDGSFSSLRIATRGEFPVEWLADVERRNNAISPDLLRTLYAPGVRYALRDPALRPFERDLFRRFGLADMLTIIAQDPDGTGVFVSLAVRTGDLYPPPRIRHQLARYSAHLASGFRLRRAIARAQHASDPGGTASARESLTSALRHLDRARGPLRRAVPGEVLALWRALVEGTWSVVDRCEADGKRYLLARRNEPIVADPVALTERERTVLAFAAMGHQDKFIAYLLGIHPSAVSRHLACASRKLGLASRCELIERFAPADPR